jgi:hypothetical protein
MMRLDDARFHRLKVPGPVLQHRPRRSPIHFPMSCEPQQMLHQHWLRLERFSCPVFGFTFPRVAAAVTAGNSVATRSSVPRQ